MMSEREQGKRALGSASRRWFLGATPFAAVGAAALAGPARAEEVAAAGDDRVVNVHRAGAVGDGETDDTAAVREAIDQAKQGGVGTVFFPAGVYVLSGTLRLPSHVTLRGQGPGLTTLKAKAGTLFDKFRPDPRTQEIRQRRTLITTESVGTVREPVTRHVGVRDMTLDWNHCPTERYGHSVVLADSVDHAVLENVHFVRCLPSDHPRDIEELSGSAFRGECVMFCNAHHGLMHRCSLTDSGYRPLSVAYNSKQIYFVNGVITASNPVWRHVFCENHGDGIPRDEKFERSQVIFLDSTFVLEGGTGQDGICSHTGTTHVENCDFYIHGGVTRHFLAFLRPFDGSRDCQYINNRFHCDVPIEGGRFTLLTTSRSGERGDNENITFAGNIARLDVKAAAEGEGEWPRGMLVDLPAGSTDRNVRIADNHAMLRFDGHVPRSLIAIHNAIGARVSGNSVDVRVAEGGEQGLPDGVVIDRCRATRVTDNAITGDYRHGVRIEDSQRVIVSGNDVSDAAESPIAGHDADDADRIVVEHNIV